MRDETVWPLLWPRPVHMPSDDHRRLLAGKSYRGRAFFSSTLARMFFPQETFAPWRVMACPTVVLRVSLHRTKACSTSPHLHRPPRIFDGHPTDSTFTLTPLAPIMMVNVPDASQSYSTSHYRSSFTLSSSPLSSSLPCRLLFHPNLQHSISIVVDSTWFGHK